MNSSNIGEYYDYAFKLLEYGKNMESIGRQGDAINSGYRPACEQLRLLFQAEQVPAKRDLLGEQISFFENKIQMYHQQQMQMQKQQQQAVPRQVQHPPPAVDQLTALCNRADRAYKDAVRLDTGVGDNCNNKGAEVKYLEAAELFMEASKLCSVHSSLHKQQHKTLTSTASSILDRIAQLRSHSKQQKASQQTEDDMFLEEFDTFLPPSVDPTRPLNRGEGGTALSSPPAPTSISSSAAHAIASHGINGSSRPRSVGGGDLTSTEIAILRRSSFINGRCFMPWMEDELTEQFTSPGGKRFTDPDGFLPLSASQISKQARYKRIHEIVASSTSSTPGGKPFQPVLIKTVSPLAITQDLVADCSFVCSLCIAAAFEARFQKKLITSIIYPQNERGVPIYNPSGKYLVKLFMNGILRKIVVDDYLPVSTHINSKGKEVFRPLCSCSSDPTEYWISLVEKAYMKLNGGYDFPGSNSGIDLHALTGWLPEQVFFVEDKRTSSSSGDNCANSNKPLDNRQREDDVWERISSAHKFGDCLITISTSNSLSEELQEASGLVPGHAYAVLNVCAAGTLRMLQVKNPWARRSWKGRFSSKDRGRWTKGLQQALGVADSDFDKMDAQGIFWIDFSDCREYFRSFFLNWNSSLFLFRTTVHGLWPVSLGPKIDTYYIGACPQYSLKIHGSCSSSDANANGVGTSIWILLSRHVVTKDVDPDSLSTAAAAALRDEETYLTMHIYRDGQRIYSPGKPLIRGIYSSDPHVLSRIDISESESKVAQRDVSLEHPHGKPIEYTLVLSQAEKLRDVYYTLSVYSTALPFQLKPCPPLPSNQLTVTGAWKAGVTAGGNVNSRLFHCNPQYLLHIPPVVRGGIDMHIHAMCGKDISASISVVDVSKNNNNGKNKKQEEDGKEENRRSAYARIDCIASDEAEVLTSGSYRCGFCVCSTALKSKEEAEEGGKQRQSKGRGKSKSSPGSFHLQAGDYTVVISAYTPQSVGNFALTFATSAGSMEDSSDTGSWGAGKVKHVRKYFTVKEIPPEGWGLKRWGLRGEWMEDDQSAGGCVNFGSFHMNPIYFLHLPEEGVFSARLNIELNCGKTGVGLNISVFCLPPSAEEDDEKKSSATETCGGQTVQTPPSIACSTPVVQTHAIYSAALQTQAASPPDAALTSNNGVYVIRPTGAFIAPAVLKAGTYLVVPSTFKKTPCKYILDAYFTPSVANSKDFKFVKT